MLLQITDPDDENPGEELSSFKKLTEFEKTFLAMLSTFTHSTFLNPFDGPSQVLRDLPSFGMTLTLMPLEGFGTS